MHHLIDYRTFARNAKGLPPPELGGSDERMFQQGQRVRFRFPDYRRYPTAGTVVSVKGDHITVKNVPDCGSVQFDLHIVKDSVYPQKPTRRPRNRRNVQRSCINAVGDHRKTHRKAKDG